MISPIIELTTTRTPKWIKSIPSALQTGINKGTITKIGLKSTTLKTMLGTEIIVSNKDLTSGQIENFGRMKDRTINFNLGVAYDTPVEKLDLVTELITS